MARFSRIRTPFFILPFCVVLGHTSGCGPNSADSPSSQPVAERPAENPRPKREPAKTPKEAVANWAHALRDDDVDAFVASVVVGEQERDYVIAQFEEMTAEIAYQTDFEKAFGKGRGPQIGIPLSDDDLGNMVVHAQSPDMVAFVVLGDPQKREMVQKSACAARKGGVWLIDTDRSMMGDFDRKKYIRKSKAVVKIISSVRAKIGKEGMTAEKVEQEYMRGTINAQLNPGED